MTRMPRRAIPVLLVAGCLAAGAAMVVVGPSVALGLGLAAIGLVVALRRGAALAGVALAVALATTPASVPTMIRVAGVDVLVLDVLAVLAVVELGARARRGRDIPVVFLASVTVVALVHGAVGALSSEALLRDARPQLLLLVGLAIGHRSSRRREARALRLLAFLLLSGATMLVAAELGFVDIDGRVETVHWNFGGGGSAEGVRRYLTSTTHLAVAVLGGLTAVVLAHDARLGGAWRRTLLVPAVVIAFLGFSRNTLLGVAAAAAFAASASPARAHLVRRAARSLAIGVAVVVAVGLVVPALGAHLDAYRHRVLDGTSQAALDDDPNVRFRAVEVEHALTAIGASPVFGGGFGAAYRPVVEGDPFEDPDLGRTYVHSAYLWYLVKTGAIGLVAMAAVVLGPVLRVARASRRRTATPVEVGLAAAAVAMLAVDLVAPVTIDPGIALTLGVIVGRLRAGVPVAATSEPADVVDESALVAVGGR